MEPLDLTRVIVRPIRADERGDWDALMRDETVYRITRVAPERGDAARLLALNRGHWAIENPSHWVRDVTFDADRSQVRKGAGPPVMACLRNFVISLIRRLLRSSSTSIASALRHPPARGDRRAHTVKPDTTRAAAPMGPRLRPPRARIRASGRSQARYQAPPRLTPRACARQRSSAAPQGACLKGSTR
jgi:hypothetical protein